MTLVPKHSLPVGVGRFETEAREALAAPGLTRQPGATGRFATPDELSGDDWRFVWGEPTILCGHADGRLIGRRMDDRHTFVCASSRSGKGVSVIVPNLVNTPCSLVVNDPKGELARMTARAKRAQGHRVIVLDPYGVSGQASDSYNFLDGIDLSGPRGTADMALLFEALIPPAENVTDGEHWTTGAREFAATVTMYAKAHHTRPTLTTLFDMIAGKHGTVLGSVEKPSELFAPMLASGAYDGALRARAISWLEIHEREQSSILSTARRRLQWLDTLNDPDAPMARICQSSTFKLADLKKVPTAVYLCLPARDIATTRGWLRAFVNMAIAALEGTASVRGAPPTLMVLDEFPTLGHMPTLEKAIGLIAGSGVRIMTVVQDLGQLKAIYPRSWGTFIGNAGVSLWFGLGGDPETADYLSRRLGTTQYYEQQEPGGSYVDRMRAGHLHGQGQWVTSPLLHPHEVERGFARETGRLLALSPGWPPAILSRVDIRDGFLSDWVDNA